MRVFLASTLGFLSLCAAGLLAAGPHRTDGLESQIDSLFSGITQPSAPGLALLVKKDGKTFFERGYGVRKVGSRTKNEPETNFRLASFTKQFTAMAIMLLIHDGKLHYEDRLSDVFREFPAYGKPITIRHLLTHTSGLPDYEVLMEQEEKARGPIWSAQHQIQDAEVLALLEKQFSGKFVPGTSWAYSNSGYVVLGVVVARISGMPYRDFLQKRVFKPAGMKHSIVYQKGINEIRQRAYGHSKEKDQFVETDQSPTSATLGDGGVYSNLQDLSMWDEALQNHTLLSEKEMAPAWTAVRLADGSEPRSPEQPDEQSLAPGKPVSYGFGWFLEPYKDHPRMWHTGGTMGFRTVIQRFTRDRLTIIILCNRLDLDPKDLAEKVADLILPASPSTKHE